MLLCVNQSSANISNVLISISIVRASWSWLCACSSYSTPVPVNVLPLGAFSRPVQEGPAIRTCSSPLGQGPRAPLGHCCRHGNLPDTLPRTFALFSFMEYSVCLFVRSFVPLVFLPILPLLIPEPVFAIDPDLDLWLGAVLLAPRFFACPLILHLPINLRPRRPPSPPEARVSFRRPPPSPIGPRGLDIFFA